MCITYMLYKKSALAWFAFINKLCSCSLCGKYFEGLLCKQCVTKLSRRCGPFCKICGATLAKTQCNKKNCKRCQNMLEQSQNSTPYVFSLWHYNKEVQKIFLLYKKHGIHLFGYFLALQLMPLFLILCERISSSSKIYIVNVPPNVKNRKRLGFNCTGLIVKYLGYYTKGVCLKGVFNKVKSPSQKELNIVDRQKNAEMSIRITKNTQKRIKNMFFDEKNSVFLLLDDVVTTGATMRACYQKLKNVLPDAKIYGISLSRVD